MPYLGPAGALVALPSPAPGYEPLDELRVGGHDLLGGGRVRDRLGVRRRYSLAWPALTDDNHSTVRHLVRQVGPYRYLDPLERNMLTANQSNGGDDLRSTEGVIARFQGSVSSSTTFERSGQRSIAWATGSALAATARGFYLYNSNTVVDATWTAVRPSTQYTVSAYMRTSAAVSMLAGWDWHDAAGVYISTSAGSGVALSTSNFNTRVTHTATSPSTAAYGIPLFTNTTTTGAAITVYLDEAQMEEAASVNTWRIGAGTPLVAVDSFGSSVLLGDASGVALHETALVLVEL